MNILFLQIKHFRDTDSAIQEHQYYLIIFIFLLFPDNINFIFLKLVSIVFVRVTILVLNNINEAYAKKSDSEKERINDDIVFEIELIKQVEVNIDYILMLVAKYHKSNCEDKTILANINKSIDASVELRSKKALIEGFVTQMTVKTDVEKDWQDFVKKQKEKDLEKIIQDEKLKHDEAQKFIENSFRDGGIKTTGTDIDKILPPISRFSGGSNRALKKQTVIDKLKGFFEKYFGVI